MKTVIFSLVLFFMFVGCGEDSSSLSSGNTYDAKSTIKKVDGVPDFPAAPRD